MKKRVTLTPVIAVISAMVLSSCQKPVTGDDLVLQCQAEIAPGGTYEYVEGGEIPEISPVEDGTQAGADALNRCIKTKAAAAGLISINTSGTIGASCPKGSPPFLGGATYCIGNN